MNDFDIERVRMKDAGNTGICCRCGAVGPVYGALEHDAATKQTSGPHPLCAEHFRLWMADPEGWFIPPPGRATH